MPSSSPETTWQQLARLPGEATKSSPAVRCSLGVLAGSQYRRIGLTRPPRPWRVARPSASYAGPRGLAEPPAVGNVLTRTDNPPSELRPLQSMTAAGCRTPGTRVVRQPLVRFVAPSARSTWRVHSTRDCLSRYVPPSGFRTPLTACSSPDYPALFHAGALMEFPPFRAFPSSGAVTPLGAPCPPVVSRTRVPCEPAGPMATSRPRHAARRSNSRIETDARSWPLRSIRDQLDFRALLPGASPLHHRGG